MSSETDVIVLGAGMAGLGAALHLQARGREVAIVDRRGPAEETSYGNAGLIQAEAVSPYSFPRDLRRTLDVLTGRSTEAWLHWPSFFSVAPWLLKYWRQGTPERIAAVTAAAAPLIARTVAEHEALFTAAGVEGLIQKRGYLRVFRTPGRLEAAAAVQEAESKRWGIAYEALTPAEISEKEPHLAQDLPGGLAGGLWMTHPHGALDPGDVGKAYAALFEARGGRILIGDAQTLARDGAGWAVATAEGRLTAREAVIALGPWSLDVLRPLRVTPPLGVKRGYHRHYARKGNAALGGHVVDEEKGFVLVPNKRGIRVTIGAEFARRDAPPSARPMAMVEPLARGLFPLGEALEDRPWMGCRPCLPDMLPVVGPVPGQEGLWAHFGHHHLGFTLGPTTGRLLAEMMTGEAPFTDPAPYRIDRF